jgi:hypothetical protein
MSRELRNVVLAAACGGALVLVWQSWPFVRVAEAQVAAAPARLLDYRTVGTDFTALPATLTELGNDGWQVVTILHTDQVVENAGDGTPHLLARRVEVVAQKPRTK